MKEKVVVLKESFAELTGDGTIAIFGTKRKGVIYGVCKNQNRELWRRRQLRLDCVGKQPDFRDRGFHSIKCVKGSMLSDQIVVNGKESMRASLATRPFVLHGG